MNDYSQQTTTITKKLSKKERILLNPDVKRWHDNLARRSKLTAEVRARRLSHFCEVHDISPIQFAEKGKQDPLLVADMLQDHVNWMTEQGKSAGYIDSTMTALKSWLSHFDIKLHRRINVGDADATPTLEDERVPNGKELSEIFSRCNLRAGASISLIAKAGLRPQVLANHDATDGLMIKDLPDLAIIQGVATFTQYPPKVIVRKTLSKANHQYFTYITRHGAETILAYLNQRILDGEALGPDTPVISPFKRYPRYRGVNKGKRFAETHTITHEIRKILRPRFKWRPYVFRAFFDTELLIAESRGKIAHDFRVFFMGHKGSMEAKYTTNKAQLPQSLENEMRDAFKRSEEFLDLEALIENEEERMKENIRTQVATMTTEQLSHVQELLNNWKTVEAVNGLSQEMKQNPSSMEDGNMLVSCPTEELSSKTVRQNRCNGPDGI